MVRAVPVAELVKKLDAGRRLTKDSVVNDSKYLDTASVASK